MRRVEISSRRRHLYRTTLYQLQDGRCIYCGCVMRIGGNAENSATLDHLVPAANGGRNWISNLVLACRRCNHRRGNGPAHVGMYVAAECAAD